MSEKTEQPTDKKIRDAREKGDIAKSRDLTQTVLVVALFSYFLANGTSIFTRLSNLALMPMGYIGVDFNVAIAELLPNMVTEMVAVLLPIVMIVLVLGIFIEALQTGMLISFEALMPSAKKLNVVANVKNIFSKQNLVEFIKSVIKIGVISWVVYRVIVDAIPVLVLIPGYTMADLGLIVGQVFKLMIIYIGGAYLAISLADLAWQRHEYTKKLMMTKDEVKQEYKGMEGDPQIKSMRKQLHQEMLQNDAVQQSRTATVLVTNPTHLAIALRYEQDDTPLPLVLAKGEGALATAMIKAAREAGVPVMQNIPLAHALFNEAEVSQYIPSDLIEPVAAVLRLVRQLAQQPGNNT